ncbi:MAG: hypothetical protein WAW86_10330 [Gammaproteobacteria bacterium]
MFQKIINLLSGSSPKVARVKHLSMQMHYPPRQIKKLLPPVMISHEELLDKQRLALEQRNQTAEACHLKANSIFVALTKQSSIAQSVFIFPAEAHKKASEWEKIKQLANEQSAGIGFFKVKKDVTCFKVENADSSVAFLVHKDAIQLDKLLVGKNR